MKVRYLSFPDVLAVGLTLNKTISIVEDSLREHGEKQVENPPKLPMPKV